LIELRRQRVGLGALEAAFGAQTLTVLGQPRGSLVSATRPASLLFSTTR
jgi:hypothetical protein